MEITSVLSVLLLTHFLVVPPVECQQTLSIDNEVCDVKSLKITKKKPLT